MTGRLEGASPDHRNKRLRVASPEKASSSAWQSASEATLIPPQALGKRELIDRKEFVRLLQQSLSDLGFEDVAWELERSSGVPTLAPDATQLRECVLSGDWTGALRHLPALGWGIQALQEAAFIILEAKFLEALGSGDARSALRCLRAELSPLGVCTARLHELSALLVHPPLAHLAVIEERRRVMERLQAVVPLGVLLPEGRLSALVEQALVAQMERCPYHNAPTPRLSLLHDHVCGLEALPLSCTQRGESHFDEVWHVAFSPNGRLLASAGKDRQAVVYDVPPADGAGTVEVRHNLWGHAAPIAFLAWSPDSRTLATCGQDCVVKLWCAATGRCLRTLGHHSHIVTCAAWMPDSRRLVTGSHDKQLCLVDAETGLVQRRWRAHMVQDIAVWGKGECFLASMAGGCVFSYDLASAAPFESAVLEAERAARIHSMSLSSSRECGHLLVNLVDGSLELWDLGSGPRPRQRPPLVMRFLPPPVLAEQRQKYIVRSCLGGLGKRFVLSGSEGGNVLMWLRATGELIAAPKRHEGTVNAVAWNPTRPGMAASVSDDRLLLMYGQQEEQEV